MYAHRSALGPVDLAFTDRYGGVSAAPFDSLNLALTGADDPEAIAENQRRVIADFAPGADLVGMHQVHGADVTVVGAGASGDLPPCDGLVTTRPRTVLMARATSALAEARAESSTHYAWFAAEAATAAD